MKAKVKSFIEIINNEINACNKITKVGTGTINNITYFEFESGDVINMDFPFNRMINVCHIKTSQYEYTQVDEDGKTSWGYKKEWLELVEEPKLEEMSIFELAQAICYHAEAIKNAIEEGDDV